MANLNRTCFLCGNKYSYCPTCGQDIYKPSWYAMWCGEECYELNDILSLHTAGKITTAEAKEKLEKIDLEKVDIKDEANAQHIQEILNSKEEKIIETKEVEVETSSVPKKILGRKKK